MAHRRFLGAALAAWFAIAGLGAQDAGGGKTVDQQLAAAALAEARGDAAAAERALTAALATAGDTERAKVQEALAALQQRRGTAVPRAQDGAVDPVQHLIAILDSGSPTDQRVQQAFTQLHDLGALALPPILEALPKLGPFGLRNGLQLIAGFDDARVPAAMHQLVAGRDPAVAAAVADVLDSMPQGTAASIAEELLDARYLASTRLRAYELLAMSRRDDARLLQVARELAALPAVQQDLLKATERVGANLDPILRELVDHGAEPVRSQALRLQLERAADLTEEQALAALATTPSWSRSGIAAVLVASRPTWVRVAVQALGDRCWEQPWFQRVEWWRGGDDAVAALLALGVDDGKLGQFSTRGNVRDVIRLIVAAGWRLPPALDAAFERFARDCTAWAEFVAALPDDAEARAISAWERTGPEARRQIVMAVLQQHRPWHRLMVRVFADARDPATVPSEWWSRDWSGVADEVVNQLASLVAQWPTGTGPQTGWCKALGVAVCRGDLPAKVLWSPARAGNAGAWRDVAASEPQLAFEAAAQWPDLLPIATDLVAAIARRGDGRQVPLCMRAVRDSRANWPAGSSAAWVSSVASNGRIVPTDPWQAMLLDARDVATRARVADLDELLRLLPDIDTACADNIVKALSSQLRAEDADKVAAALATQLDIVLAVGARGSESGQGGGSAVHIAQLLLGSLEQMLAEQALAPAERILAARAAPTALTDAAARTKLAVTRQNRAAVIAALLDDARPSVVETALMAEDLRDDATLRERALAAIRRCGAKLESLDSTFAHLRPDDRRALAQQLVDDEGWPQFSSGVAYSVVTALGDLKDGALVASIARGARHPDADVRQLVAVALGRTFAKAAVPFLLELLKDDSDGVREQATKGLDELGKYLEARRQWDERLK